MHTVKAIEIVSAIHKKVQERSASYRTPEVLEEWSKELVKLQNAYNAAYCARNLVGRAPQLPNMLLGVIAGWVIRLAQRLLAWYTPQIQAFNEAATNTLARLCSLEERKYQLFLTIEERLGK